MEEPLKLDMTEIHCTTAKFLQARPCTFRSCLEQPYGHKQHSVSERERKREREKAMERAPSVHSMNSYFIARNRKVKISLSTKSAQNL